MTRDELERDAALRDLDFLRRRVDEILAERDATVTGLAAERDAALARIAELEAENEQLANDLNAILG